MVAFEIVRPGSDAPFGLQCCAIQHGAANKVRQVDPTSNNKLLCKLMDDLFAVKVEETAKAKHDRQAHAHAHVHFELVELHETGDKIYSTVLQWYGKRKCTGPVTVHLVFHRKHNKQQELPPMPIAVAVEAEVELFDERLDCGAAEDDDVLLAHLMRFCGVTQV